MSYSCNVAKALFSMIELKALCHFSWAHTSSQLADQSISDQAGQFQESGILHNITFKILSMSHHCVTRVSHRLTDSYRRCFLFSLYLILLKMLGLLLLFAIMLNQLLMLGLALRLEPGRSNPRRLFRNSVLWRRLKSNNFCLEFHFLVAVAYFDWVHVI